MQRRFPRPRAILASPLVACAILAASGCGGTQVSGENRDLVVSLATATSTREPKWLDKSAALVEERRASGKCSDAEYAAFQEIIAKGRSGDWDAARDAAYALRDAQQPTADDLKHLEEGKLEHRPKPPPKPGRAGRA
ncbi:hypothetical protein [Paludisphaera sp.]|uniref:hypothetical protein n=1 Tax=Paludisphaera sp. TaxID=2017432 RepID=UPI00301D0BCB